MKKKIVQSTAVVMVLFAMTMNTLTVPSETVVASSRTANIGLAAGHIAGVSRIVNSFTENKTTVALENSIVTGHTAGASRTVSLINTQTVSLMESDAIIEVAEGDEGALTGQETTGEAAAEPTADVTAEGAATEITEGDARPATVEEVKEAVNAPAEEPQTEETVSEEWKNKLMVDVEDYLYVREAPSTDSEVVGKLRKGDVADILEETNGWYKITSGSVSGYVSGDYSVTDSDAESLASEVCETYVVAKEGGLRVRSVASTDGDIVTTMGEGDKATLDAEAEATAGWVAVSFRGLSGYVNEEYVELTTDYGEGITVEEEQAAIEAERKAEEERQAAQVSASTVAPVQNAPTAASFDEVTLLAALIQSESGNQPIEG